MSIFIAPNNSPLLLKKACPHAWQKKIKNWYKMDKPQKLGYHVSNYKKRKYKTENTEP